MNTKNRIRGINADRFDKKSFDTIHNKIDTKQDTGHMDALPDEPQNDKQNKACNNFIKRGRKNRLR